MCFASTAGGLRFGFIFRPFDTISIITLCSYDSGLDDAMIGPMMI